jgi:hypothetical protein
MIALVFSPLGSKSYAFLDDLSCTCGGGKMQLGTRVEALLHIRKLRGGSQPILVRANDGFFYIVKFINNLQGANVLFNEALGTELFRGVGLPAPEWRAINLTDEFIDRNPACWMETEDGRRRPQAGWCFGSRFLAKRNSDVFEVLPERCFSRIANRSDFWTAWVLDTLCGHTDNRQTLFLQSRSKRLEAYFIDHGHLFGGVSGADSPSPIASRYLDPRIYSVASTGDADDIVKRIQCLNLEQLRAVANNLPEPWSTEAGKLSFARFARRISDPILLRSAVHFILHIEPGAEGGHDRHLAKASAGRNRAALHGQIPPTGVEDRFDRGSCDLAGHQRQRRAATVRALCPQAANFGS